MWTYVKPFCHTKQLVVRYRFSNPLIKNLQYIVARNDLKMKVAPRPTSNNKQRIFSRIKDCRKRSILYTWTMTMKHFDVQRSIKRILQDKNLPCNRHPIQFPQHKVTYEVIQSHNKEVEKYPQWMNYVIYVSTCVCGNRMKN